MKRLVWVEGRQMIFIRKMEELAGRHYGALLGSISNLECRTVSREVSIVP
jgi:hypothetical protein